MQVTTVNGLHLHYLDEGSRALPAIVLINSLGTDLRCWDAVVVALKKKFRCIRYDKRGHGLSDAPSGPYSIDDHVRDLSGLLDSLDVEQVILCGLSVGGMIAMGYADKNPQRVAALILADTAHKIGTAEMWNQRIHAIESDGLASIAEPVMQRWFTDEYLDKQRESVSVWINMLSRTPVDGYTGTCAAIRDADLTQAAVRITVPTLCLCGDEDGATPPGLVSSLAGLIPRAQFHLIPGAGHIPCVEQPARFIELLENFLEGQDLGR